MKYLGKGIGLALLLASLLFVVLCLSLHLFSRCPFGKAAGENGTAFGGLFAAFAALYVGWQKQADKEALKADASVGPVAGAHAEGSVVPRPQVDLALQVRRALSKTVFIGVGWFSLAFLLSSTLATAAVWFKYRVPYNQIVNPPWYIDKLQLLLCLPLAAASTSLTLSAYARRTSSRGQLGTALWIGFASPMCAALVFLAQFPPELYGAAFSSGFHVQFGDDLAFQYAEYIVLQKAIFLPLLSAVLSAVWWHMHAGLPTHAIIRI